MILYETVIAFVSFWSFLLILVLFVLFGWFCVWSLFLSRFRFVRELIGGVTDSPLGEEVRQNRGNKKILRKD